MNAEPILVVGTGRCGSTALSAAIRTNPRWLSLSELFSSLFDRDFGGELSGAEFASRLAEPTTGARLLLRHRLEPSEMLYPVDGGGRYTRETSVPPPLLVTLPHLVGTGDELLDELLAQARERPAGPAGEHFRALLDGLAESFGAERWLERSGGTIGRLAGLLEWFPDARVVHVYRGGVPTVRSMARHNAFRLAAARTQMWLRFEVDAYLDERRPPGLLASNLAPFLPEQFDAEAFRNRRFPLWWFATMYAASLEHGLPTLLSLPPERVLHLRFEDLLAEPRAELERFAQFVDGEPDPGWAARAAAEVRPELVRSEGTLDTATMELVERAERPLRDAGL